MRLSIALCLLLVGCDSGARDVGVRAYSPVHRPALTAVEATWVRPQSVVLHQVEMLQRVSDWSIECADPEPLISTLESGDHHLSLRCAGDRVIRIPGPFEVGNTQAVRITGIFPKPQLCSFELTRADGTTLAGAPVPSRGRFQPQRVVMRLPAGVEASGSIDSLSLRIRGPGPGVQIQAVEFVQVKLELELPGPDRPGMIAVAGEERAGIGLTAGRPVMTVFDVEEGAELRLGVAWFGPFASDEDAALRIVRDDGVRHIETRYPLDSAHPEWSTIRIPLGLHEGKQLNVQFHLGPEQDSLAIVALQAPSVVVPDDSAPTVLLITSDTHRGDHMGLANGSVTIQTPWLDALAARGVYFENCFSTTNVTAPSHVSIMTGLHPRDTKILDHSTFLSGNAETLAEIFSDAGWSTIAVSSIPHLGTRSVGLGQGFDRLAYPTHGVWDAEDALIRFDSMVEEAEGKPLFAWVHLFDAHYPYEPPGEFDRKYYPPGKDPFSTELPPLEESSLLPSDLSDLRDLEFPKSQYRAEISYLDTQLQRFSDWERFRTGITVFTADHGEMFGKHGVYFDHNGLYPDTLHVPLVISWPGARGTRRSDPVSHLDLAATILDLAGIEDQRSKGASFVSRESESELPRFALSAHALSASVSTGVWHLVLQLEEPTSDVDGQRTRHQVQLFNRTEDPECVVDRAADLPAEAGRLRRLLLRWLADSSDSSLGIRGRPDQETLDEIAALGYVASSARDNFTWIEAACSCAECARWVRLDTEAKQR